MHDVVWNNKKNNNNNNYDTRARYTDCRCTHNSHPMCKYIYIYECVRACVPPWTLQQDNIR